MHRPMPLSDAIIESARLVEQATERVMRLVLVGQQVRPVAA